MSIFKLPDLGEGLQEAELVEWHVKVDDEVAEDQPLLAVETAKAIVDLPCPRKGRIGKLYGEAGDIVQVGDPLVEFSNDESTRPDAGTVVGRMETGQGVVKEAAAPLSPRAMGVKATPAVRALAQGMKVDLTMVTPSGPDSTVTAEDVQRVARILGEAGPMEPLHGVRRAMARSMAQAHAEVADVTVCDDADIDSWPPDEAATLRLIRAIVAACQKEPALNAWYDSHAVGRRVLDKINLGIAVDTRDGLFVPVLRDVAQRSPAELRQMIDDFKEKLESRSIPPEDLRGYTFTLSNFGTFGGRYADPVIVPPTVAILGAGRIRDAVVAVAGKAAVHRILPLSLTFDHRAVTGGEATRFLAAVIDDLETPGQPPEEDDNHDPG